ncbi:MAG: signal peptidase II [Hylemonella sp.]|uniref:signal peptidase II n=1 Tax=Hylemonella sp. TaxID=2066020 RepID=UPI0022BD5806|nr:signal peptidase II [Hylemonella sp.]MCZ8252212.1 signal peptidase II [Hylemonella sp.]
MGKTNTGGLLQWLGVAFLILVLDQLSKVAILLHYQLGESTYLTEWLNLVRVHNSGAAFSFLAGAGGWQRWFFVGIGAAATVFMIYLMRSHPTQKLFCLALACIMGGAVGNVLDRLIHGYVVDMVDFHIGSWHFPAFNLADSAITLGVILLLLDEILRVRRSRH